MSETKKPYNGNKHNLQVNDIVITDKNKGNTEPVKILHITPQGMFSTVQAPNGYTWDIMTSRLTKCED
jgi:hypothetical protein